MKRIANFVFAGMAAAAGFLPLLASAACTPGNGIICPPDVAGVQTVTGVKSVILCGILNWLFTVAIVISVGAIIFAAISYITSGGGEKTGKAHQALTYAVIGIAVAILAKGIPVIIGTFINSGSSPFSSSQIC